MTSIVGTQWDVEADTLSYRVKEKFVPDTWRGMLSLISSIYDPLGFAAPLILPVKMLLKDLCTLDYGWDAATPDEILVEWRTWLENLPKLKLVSWPHCFKPSDFGVPRDIQLHHFCDTSKQG